MIKIYFFKVNGVRIIRDTTQKLIKRTENIYNFLKILKSDFKIKNMQNLVSCMNIVNKCLSLPIRNNNNFNLIAISNEVLVKRTSDLETICLMQNTSPVNKFKSFHISDVHKSSDKAQNL